MSSKAIHPVIESLRSATAPLLTKQMHAMFHGADDTLFQMCERSTSDTERRTYFDAMRMLRLEQRHILEGFERAVDVSFHPGTAATPADVDFDRLAVVATDELEERLAIGNLVRKAEDLYRAPLHELEKRIGFMIRDLGIPISSRALSPATLCEALRCGLEGLKLELSVRLLLYKLYDRQVACRLQDVYDAALQTLDRLKIQPRTEPISKAPSRPNPPQAPAAIAAALPIVAPETLNALRQLGQSPVPQAVHDAALAQDLIACISATADSLAFQRSMASAQRLSLIGQMLNEILTDPNLPPGMHPLFERLRIPLIKIVLADGSFFANRGHPVRRLIAEAAETAASSRAANSATVRTLENRLRQIADQIDLSAAFVHPHLDTLAPLNEAEIRAFLDQQREESEARRENVLNKVRRTVAQELEIHTLGRDLPDSLSGFLRAGWGPLMAARLLRTGMSSRKWIESVNRLIQILASMDVDAVTPEQIEARRELDAAVAADLAEIGMGEERIAGSLVQLRKAYAELDTRLGELMPDGRPDADTELLSPKERSELLEAFPEPEPARAAAVGDEPSRVLSLHGSSQAAATASPPIERQKAQPERGVAPSLPAPAAPASAAEATAPAGDAETELLRQCLTAESWFRVYDSNSGQTLWLKVTRYYPDHDSVGFNGFDAKKTLSIRASRFLDDLVSGRSEPVNPSPVQARALAELRAGRKQAR